MRNGSNNYLKVKHLATFTIFPKLVNHSLPFINQDISEQFIKMLIRASKIRWGNDAELKKYQMPFLNLHNDFIKSKALVIKSRREDYSSFSELFEIFLPYFKDSSE